MSFPLLRNILIACTMISGSAFAESIPFEIITSPVSSMSATIEANVDGECTTRNSPSLDITECDLTDSTVTITGGQLGPIELNRKSVIRSVYRDTVSVETHFSGFMTVDGQKVFISFTMATRNGAKVPGSMNMHRDQKFTLVF